MTTSVHFAAPYPGLRPFKLIEAPLFFGRGSHITKLIKILDQQHFLAVVGSSGCGKSSLVRAGLLPALESGFLGGRDVQWRFVMMRPGGAPYANLARELVQALSVGNEGGSDARTVAFRQATLQTGPRGLLDAVSDSLLPDNTRVLVLVDQFEEIFRFRPSFSDESSPDGQATDDDRHNEALAFVDMLLSTARPCNRVYVVLTMRSDFLGECDAFRDLPKVINESQFLPPRLSRDELRDAVECPPRHKQFRGTIESAVTAELINAMGDRQDQLPLIQHALLRMWTLAKEDSNSDEPIRIIADHLERCGGVADALNRHADEIYDSLDTRQQRIAERMLCSLCQRSAEGRLVRRLTTVGEVSAVAGVTAEEVIVVAQEFMKPGRNFLVASSSGRGPTDVVDEKGALRAEPRSEAAWNDKIFLDISHESLIRQWDRLSKWAEKESESARRYRRLLETAELWKDGEASLWTSTELYLAEKWRNEQEQIAEWTKRYGGPLELSLQILDASLEAEEIQRRADDERRQAELKEKEHKQREEEERRRVALRQKAKRRRQMKLAVTGAVVLLMIASVSTVAAFFFFNAQYWEGVAHRGTQDKLEAVEQQRKETNIEKEKAQRSAYSAQLARVYDELSHDRFEAERLLNDTERCPDELKDFTWHLYFQISQRRPLRLEEHTMAVNSVIYSNDGKYLATASDDGTVLLWDATTGKVLMEFDGHAAAVLAVAFNPAGTMLASADETGTIRLWDVHAGSEVERPPLDGHQGPVTSMVFSTHGKILASAGHDRTIRLSAVATDEVKLLMGHTNWVTCVAFSPGENPILASASRDATIKFWDPATGDELTKLDGQPDSVLCIAFSPDGNTLASGTMDGHGTIRLWNIVAVHKGKRPTLTSTFTNRSGGVYSLDFSYDGRTLASAGEGGSIKLWDLSQLAEGDVPRIRTTFSEHVGIVYSVAFSPTKIKLASAGSDGTVRLWDAAAGQETMGLVGHGGSIHSLLFGPAAKRLISASKDGKALVWSTETGTALPQQFGAVTSLAHSQDQITVALAHKAENATDVMGTAVTVWNINRLFGDEPSSPRFRLETHSGPITALALSLDGKILAIAHGDDDDTTAEKLIRLWDTDQVSREQEQQPRATFTTHTGNVTSLAFASFDGQIVLASASEDSTVRLWDVEAGLERRVVTVHQDSVLSVAFSPNSKWLATGGEVRPDSERMAGSGDDTSVNAWLWDVGKLLSEDKTQSPLPLTGHNGAVTSMAFSPDGRTLASAGMRGTIRLWDPITGQWRGTLTGQTGGVRIIAFSADSKMLASAGDNDAIKLWIGSAEKKTGITSLLLQDILNSRPLDSGLAPYRISTWRPSDMSDELRRTPISTGLNELTFVRYKCYFSRETKGDRGPRPLFLPWPDNRRWPFPAAYPRNPINTGMRIAPLIPSASVVGSGTNWTLTLSNP